MTVHHTDEKTSEGAEENYEYLILPT